MTDEAILVFGNFIFGGTKVRSPIDGRVAARWGTERQGATRINEGSPSNQELLSDSGVCTSM